MNSTACSAADSRPGVCCPTIVRFACNALLSYPEALVQQLCTNMPVHAYCSMLGLALLLSPALCEHLLYGVLLPRINCNSGASYDSVVQYFIQQDIRHWSSRDCFPYVGAPSDDCSMAGEGFCASQLPPGGEIRLLRFRLINIFTSLLQ
jgi:hypothetical protein